MGLEINHLCKSFYSPGTGMIQVLNDVNLQVRPGRTYAVVGQSGSGKTTLLSLIAGLDSPDSGDIILDGENLSFMNEDRLARFRAEKIGIIFQQFHLMPHLTAQENISLPLEILKAPDIEKQTRAMLEMVDLTHRRHHLPGTLSGGECQRVAIARALIIKPSLILADEPTGNLDTVTGETVADMLFNLVETENKSLILVTHNPSLAGRCRSTFTLERGVLS